MLRSFSRYIYLSMAGAFKVPSNGIHIMNGHYISRDTVSKEVFYSLLEKLNKNASLIRIEEATELVSKRVKVKDKLIAFTFDDEFEECHSKIAPVLESFNTNAAFFINPGFVNGDITYRKDFLENKVLTKDKTPMDWLQIKELHQRGHIIGAHTVDHIRLITKDEDILKKQLVDCRNIIEKEIGNTCNYFAYPYGQLEDLGEKALAVSCNTYDYVFSGANYGNYFSFNGKVINRRHFEGDWPATHLNYFLSTKRSYD